MSPLIQSKSKGVIFQDEPTETHVYEKYGQDWDTINSVLNNIGNVQTKSEFAARIYPELLFSHNKFDEILTLAFSEQFPNLEYNENKINRIRLNRLQTALKVASQKKDFSQLLKIIIDLVVISKTEERNRGFLVLNPDLAIGFDYPDTINWLSESRQDWQGAYYSRLVTAQLISNELNEASDYFKEACDFLNWYYKNRNEQVTWNVDIQPEDLSAVALYYLSSNKLNKVANFPVHEGAPFGYFVFKRMIEHCLIAEEVGTNTDLSIKLSNLLKHKALTPQFISALFSVAPQKISTKQHEKKLLRIIANNVKKHGEFTYPLNH